MPRGRPRKNVEGLEGEQQVENKKSDVIEHEMKIAAIDKEGRELSKKDWENNSYYVVSNGKLLKCTKAKNGNLYKVFVFKIKNKEDRERVELLKKQGKVKSVEGIKL